MSYIYDHIAGNRAHGQLMEATRALAPEFFTKYPNLSMRIGCVDTLEVVMRDPATIPVAMFYLQEQPNCCGQVISHSTHVLTPHRRQGIGRQLVGIKEGVARYMGYNAISATVVTGNSVYEHPEELEDETARRFYILQAVEARLLLEHRWTLDYTWWNKRTNNKITHFHKLLY